jgi:hypothetical protein
MTLIITYRQHPESVPFHDLETRPHPPKSHGGLHRVPNPHSVIWGVFYVDHGYLPSPA